MPELLLPETKKESRASMIPIKFPDSLLDAPKELREELVKAWGGLSRKDKLLALKTAGYVLRRIDDDKLIIPHHIQGDYSTFFILVSLVSRPDFQAEMLRELKETLSVILKMDEKFQTSALSTLSLLVSSWADLNYLRTFKRVCEIGQHVSYSDDKASSFYWALNHLVPKSKNPDTCAFESAGRLSSFIEKEPEDFVNFLKFWFIGTDEYYPVYKTLWLEAFFSQVTDSQFREILALLKNPNLVVPSVESGEEETEKGLITHYLQAGRINTLNWVYGRAVFGNENTWKLYEQRNIRYFLRYSKEELERQLYQVDVGYSPKYVSREDIEKQYRKPTFLVIYNHRDLNGAFYKDNKKFDYLSSQFDVVLYEADSERDFYAAVKQTNETYGKITHLLIGAHGDPDSMELGFTYNEKYKENVCLDLTDAKELEELRKYLEGVIIILESCSTGKNKNAIGALIHKSTGAKRTFAPKVPSYILQDGWKIEKINGVPTVVDVKYKDEKSIYGSE